MTAGLLFFVLVLLATAVASVCFGFLLAGAALLATAESARRQAVARRARDAALGLTKDGQDLVGRVEGREVHLSNHVVSTGKGSVIWWTTRVGVPEVRDHLELIPVEVFESGGHATGDAAFDAVSRVPGRYPLALAWLEARNRALLGTSRAKLRDGVLSTTATAEPSEAHVRALVAAANRMGAVEPAASLAAIATTDAPKVRVRALGLLAGVDRARATELARGAAQSDVLEERSLALVLVGDQQVLVDRLERGSDEDRHELLDALSRFGTPALVAAAADALPAGPLPRPLWFVLTAAVAAHPSRAALDAVLRRWPAQLEAHAEFAADRLLVAATALGDPELEGTVAEALGSARQEAERGLRWLAEHGTVASVPALDALLAGTWPLTELRDHATTCKRAIQGRAAGARGGLSEAGPAGGGLTEVEGAADAARRGRLALRQ